MKNLGFGQNSKKKVCLSALISTCFLLALLVPLNYLAIRHPFRYYFTEKSNDLLHPESIQVVKKLEQPLTIILYDRDINPFTKALLASYQRHSSYLTYQLVSPELDSQISERQGSIELFYGEVAQSLQANSTSFGLEITEAQLSNAIAKLVQPQMLNLYWLEPHSQEEFSKLTTEYSQAISKLQQQGYQVKTLNLVNYQVPQNASAIAISQPLQKLTEIEVTRLQEYLKRGGSLLVMLLPNTEVGLEAIWQEYGVELDHRLLIDGSKRSDRSPIEITTDRYANHPIVDGISAASIFTNSRPIKIVPQPKVQATPLVTTDNFTWADGDLSQSKVGFDPQQDLRGNLNLAVSLEKKNNSRLVVFGNGVFANNVWFDRGANQELFLATIDWLVGLDREVVVIPEREIVRRHIQLKPWQAYTINLLGIKIIPGLAAIAAILLWLLEFRKK